jgi:excisionase family DNA binding protein
MDPRSSLIVDGVLRPYLTAREAAQYLNVSYPSIELWRREGRGPAYSKLGRKIIYTREALDKFVADRLTTAPTGAKRPGK